MKDLLAKITLLESTQPLTEWVENPDFDTLWNKHVPREGEAKTPFGEAIRALGRLEYDYYNNGYGNARETEEDEPENDYEYDYEGSSHDIGFSPFYGDLWEKLDAFVQQNSQDPAVLDAVNALDTQQWQNNPSLRFKKAIAILKNFLVSVASKESGSVAEDTGEGACGVASGLSWGESAEVEEMAKYGDDTTVMEKNPAKKVDCPLLKGLSSEEYSAISEYIRSGGHWSTLMDQTDDLYSKIFDNAYKMRDYLQDEGLSSADRGDDHHLDNIDSGVQADLENYFGKTISEDTDPLDEGDLGKSLKRVGKSIKRGLHLWDKPFTGSPRDVVNRNRAHSDADVVSLRKSNTRTNKGSPQDLQNKVLDREIKKRGLTMDEGAKYTPETPYGVQYKIFAGKEQRLTTKESWFKSAKIMDRAIEKIKDLDGFYEIVGYHYPEHMTKESTYSSGAADEFSGSGSAQVNESSLEDLKKQLSALQYAGPYRMGTKRWDELKKLKSMVRSLEGVDPLQEKARTIRKKLRDAGFDVRYTDRLKAGGWSLKIPFSGRWGARTAKPKVEALLKNDGVYVKEVKQPSNMWRPFDSVLRIIVKDAIKEDTLSPMIEESISIGGKSFPSNRVPIEHYDAYRKANPGSVVRFRGPRGRSEDPVKSGEKPGYKAHTTRANATHFYVVSEEELNEKSKSKKQAKFMAACAHGAGYSSCPPMSVSKEFNRADKGTKNLKNESLPPVGEEKEYLVTFVYQTKDGKKGEDSKKVWAVSGEAARKLVRGDLRRDERLKSFGIYDDMPVGEKARDPRTGNDKPAYRPNWPEHQSKNVEANKEKLKKTNEVSKKTLGNYVKKANAEVAGHSEASPIAHSHKKSVYHLDKAAKRSVGINKAVDKLTKESKENKMKRQTVKESIQVDDPGLERVLRHFGKEVRDFQEGGLLDDHLYNALYDYWFDEMPYGTKKARDGDPFQWVEEKLSFELGREQENIDIDLNAHGIEPEGEYDMGEGAAGDSPVYGSGNDMSPLSKNDLEEGNPDRYADWEWQQQMTQPAASPTVPANPALSAKIAAAKAAARAANAAAPSGGAMPQPVLKKPGQQVGVSEEADMDETFLVEGLEGVITEILEEYGLDHGLDFFFDNGLVAIGKSTARVIVNALKADPRIKAVPSFGRIDGEEVQIAFNKEPKAPVKDLRVDEIPPADFNPEEPNTFAAESTVNEEVGLSLTATGEEDALNVIRKLSGLSLAEPAPEEDNGEVGPEEEVEESLDDNYFIVDGDTLEILKGPMNAVTARDDLHANYRKYDSAEVCSGAELEQKIKSRNSVDEDEGEYVNAPDPTVHTSTTDMINRGNDLNKPKRQDYTIRNLGNNPMAETRNLFKQYEAMKDEVKK